MKAEVAVMAARQAGKPAINNVTTLTLQQAAVEARVSVETLRGWCIRDTSLAFKKGGRWQVSMPVLRTN